MSKRCQGFCNRTYDEYYVVHYSMDEYRVLCAKCWERELDDLRYKLRNLDAAEKQESIEAKRFAQQIDMDFRKRMHEHNTRFDDISFQVRNLEDEIRIKTQTREWSEYESGDSYNSNKPYNYEDVAVLRSRLWKLKEEERNRYKTSPRFPNVNLNNKPSQMNLGSLKRINLQSSLNSLIKAIYYSPSEAIAKEKYDAEQETIKKAEKEERQKELERKTIAEAQLLFKKAQNQELNRHLQKVKERIAEIEVLVRKETYVDSLNAIELLTKSFSWKCDSEITVEANLADFDNQFNKAKEEQRIAELKRQEEERKRKEAERIAEQQKLEQERKKKEAERIATLKREEAERVVAQRKRDAEERARKQRESRAEKRFLGTLFWIGAIIGVIVLIKNCSENSQSARYEYNGIGVPSASSSSSSRASASAITPILGTWRGVMNDSQTWSSYEMVLNNSSGQLSVNYPTLRCRTNLTLTENDSSVFVFTERLLSGNCTNGDKITFQKISDNKINVWVEVKSDGRRIIGTLERY